MMREARDHVVLAVHGASNLMAVAPWSETGQGTFLTWPSSDFNLNSTEIIIILLKIKMGRLHLLAATEYSTVPTDLLHDA
eukprot:6186501-Pleurochrysis_carterae.AAC.4